MKLEFQSLTSSIHTCRGMTRHAQRVYFQSLTNPIHTCRGTKCRAQRVYFQSLTGSIHTSYLLSLQIKNKIVSIPHRFNSHRVYR